MISMPIPIEDFELIARNLASARDYPDAVVLKYTAKSLLRSHNGDIVKSMRNELVDFSLAKEMMKNATGWTMGRTAPISHLQVLSSQLNPVSETAQLASFWAFFIATERIRFAKRLAFSVSSILATLALGGMFLCLYSAVDVAVTLVVNYVLLCIALISGLAGVLFHLKLRLAKEFYDDRSFGGKLSAYSIARKAKNGSLIIALVLLFMAFLFLCILSTDGKISTLGFFATYISLVLALEFGLISALFQIKQQAAIENLERITDLMCSSPDDRLVMA